MKKCLFVLIPVVMAASLASCSRRDGSEDADRLTICFGFQDLETEYWVAAHKAITETLRAKGIKVLERNANQDANRQLEQIRDAIAQDVDGILIIPQDGESAVTIIGEANRAGIPIGVFNRPPANRSNPALVILADNAKIAEETVAYMVEMARKRNRKATPLILVGDLGDQNSVERKKGFYNAINRHPDLFNKTIEVPTKWDAATTLANLEAAMQTNPEVDFLFTSSDFLYPQVKAVLEPLGKWKPIGNPDHVILGGLDGDSMAYTLMKDGYVDATGVQDLFFEAHALMDAILEAIEKGQTTPENWMTDPGFALTQANMAEKASDMWGYRVLQDGLTGTNP
jgi:inositol transport system substrate-binding protein